MTQASTQVEPPPVQPPLIGQATQMSISGLVLIIFLGIIVANHSHIPDSIAGQGALPDRGDYHAAVIIDINTATPRELTLLPGIGPVLAHRIAANRERLGRFDTIAELDRVYGVGPRTIDQIDRFAVVGGNRRFASVNLDDNSDRARDR